MRTHNQRRLVTPQELAAYLTAQIQKVRGCERCYIHTILPYQQPDEDGCNWSRGYVRLSVVGNVPVSYVGPQARQIVEEAAMRFNLKPERAELN